MNIEKGSLKSGDVLERVDEQTGEKKLFKITAATEDNVTIENTIIFDYEDLARMSFRIARASMSHGYVALPANYRLLG